MASQERRFELDGQCHKGEAIAQEHLRDVNCENGVVM
jgi:hypothetical protein